MPVLRDREFKSRRTGISFASHLLENGKPGAVAFICKKDYASDVAIVTDNFYI